MTLKEEIESMINILYGIPEETASEIAEYTEAMFIRESTQRLIDAGYQPDGKAIKAIEGMRND